MRFSTFLLLFLFIFSFGTAASAQNLIYDWSVEEYEECPYLLTLEMFVPHWKNFRGNPDYFNTCSPNLGPLTNPFGWQHPRTGEALMGVITFHAGLTNGREYAGVQLLEPLAVGESYDISFYAASAYSPDATGRATNNLGILLMTENYLTQNELGVIPNFAHFSVDTIVADTSNWVYIGGSIVADSAYQYVAFGNFFDDELTQVAAIDPNDPDPNNLAYYYFDDFCVTLAGGECSTMLTAERSDSNKELVIYPNPSSGSFMIEGGILMHSMRMLNLSGSTIYEFTPKASAYAFKVSPRSLTAGVYIIEIKTEEGILRRRVAINP